MKALFDARQRAHDPKYFLVNGALQPSPEQPKRIDALMRGLSAAGCTVEAPQNHGLAPLAAVHSAQYLHFLQTIRARWSQVEGAAAEVVPNIHPDLRDDGYLVALETALETIRAFAADTLVVALGLYAHEGDPLEGFSLTTPGFARIAAAIAALGLPSLLVQEGGYPQVALGDNLRSFLDGWG